MFYAYNINHNHRFNNNRCHDRNIIIYNNDTYCVPNQLNKIIYYYDMIFIFGVVVQQA